MIILLNNTKISTPDRIFFFIPQEGETEEMLSEWLFGINKIMKSGGRSLTRNDLEEPPVAEPTPAPAPAPAANANANTTSVPKPIIASTPAKNAKRRYSIQVVKTAGDSLRSGVSHSGFSAEAPRLSSIGTDSVMVQAQVRGFKKRLIASVTPQIASVRRDVDAQQVLVSQELDKMRESMEFVVEAVSTRVAEEQRRAKEEKLTILRALKAERELRVRLMNQLIEEHGNIRVFARVRPMGAHEGNQDACVVVDDSANANKTFASEEEELLHAISGEKARVEVLNVDGEGQIIEGDGCIGARGGSNVFEFDKVFGPSANQNTVGREVLPFVRSCLDGYNVCIFAYGQTGSGKTFTMEGSAAAPGVNFTALGELFRQTAIQTATAAKAGHELDFAVEVSVMEIYNEIPRDLLAEQASDAKLDIRCVDGSVTVPGLTRIRVESSDEVKTLLDTRAKPNRSVARTQMNSESSRSHCVLFVHVRSVNKQTRESATGKLVLVDLAGSERVLKSGVQGQALKEAQNINKSLSALGDVIQALQSKDKHVPYRNSKLTFLLQDCLGGHAKCLMFCNVSPAASNQNETVCSLRFAARARNTQLGKAKKHTSSAPTPVAEAPVQSGAAARAVEELRLRDREVAALRSEVQSLQAERDQHLRAAAGDSRAKDVLIRELQQRVDQQQRQIEIARRQSVASIPRSRTSMVSAARRRGSVATEPMATPRRSAIGGQKRKSFDSQTQDDGENRVASSRSASRVRSKMGETSGSLKRSSTVGSSKPAATSTAPGTAKKQRVGGMTRPQTASTPRKPLGRV
jgi:kinesin family protein C2/C3